MICRRCASQRSLSKFAILPRHIFEISSISIYRRSYETENTGRCVYCTRNHNNCQRSTKVQNRYNTNRCNFKGQPWNGVKLLGNVQQIEQECCDRLKQAKSYCCTEKCSAIPDLSDDDWANDTENYHTNIQLSMNRPQIFGGEANFRINCALIWHSTMKRRQSCIKKIHLKFKSLHHMNKNTVHYCNLNM